MKTRLIGGRVASEMEIDRGVRRSARRVEVATASAGGGLAPTVGEVIGMGVTVAAMLAAWWIAVAAF